MKNLLFTFTFLLTCLCLTSCGNSNEAQREYYIIETENEVLFNQENLQTELTYVNAQYHNEQAIQIRKEEKKDENLYIITDLYLCRADGSKELLLENVSSEHRRDHWYLGEDNYLYSWSQSNYFKYNKDGTVLFSGQAEGVIQDVFQRDTGGIILLIRNTNGGYRLVQMNAETGILAEEKSIYFNEEIAYCCGYKDHVYLLIEHGIYEVDMTNGSRKLLMPFGDSDFKLTNSYGQPIAISDFRVLDENRADILSTNIVRKLTRINKGETHQILLIRVTIPSKALLQCIDEYNKQSDTFYVGLQTVESEENDWKTFFDRTNVQLAAGEGADIIFGNAISDEISILEKNVFVDLAPLMEESGIRRDDYYPIAYECWQKEDKIYGVQMAMQAQCKWISSEFVGNKKISDISDLLNRLKEYEGNAVFFDSYDAQKVLEYFLHASDTLHGMINWETADCNFNTELFHLMLEMAKRYEDDEKNDYPAIVGPRRVVTLYSYDSIADLNEAEREPFWAFFDNGQFPTSATNRMMGINAASPYIDAAWDFIRYLLTDGQSNIPEMGDSTFPVNRAAFQALVQQEIEEGCVVFLDGTPAVKRGDIRLYKQIGLEEYRKLYDIKPEIAAEAETILQNTIALPVRTQPILNIIKEETASYFAGDKTFQEIVPIIENRVRIYLQERQ